MIGQEKIISKLFSYSLDKLPRTIMLLGERGCGKHTLVNEVSTHFNLEIEDITNSLNLETINDIYTRPLPKFYLIDTTLINEKQQNVILKFLEEPSKSTYIILLCENKHTLLGTILNRCFVLEFEQYTKEQLKDFVVDKEHEEYILEMCKTPGQVKGVNAKTLESTSKLCNNIVSKLRKDKVTLASALSIVNKINFKDEYDKTDLKIFFDILCSKVLSEYKTTNSKELKKMYTILDAYANRFRDSRYNGVQLFESMLIDIWNMERMN